LKTTPTSAIKATTKVLHRRCYEESGSLVEKGMRAFLLCISISFCAISPLTWGETIPVEQLWGWPKGAGSPWGSSACPAATYEFITKDKFGCAPIAEQCHPNKGQSGYSPFYGTQNCGINTADHRVAGGGAGWTACPQGFTLDSGGATCSRPNCSDTQFRDDSGSCSSIPPAIETGSTSGINACTPDGVKIGKPIIPATGEKILDEQDFASSGPDALSLSRHYGSSRVVGAVTGSIPAGLGKPWSHNLSTFLKQEGISGIAGSMARVLFGDGSVRGFNWDTANNNWKPANSADTLISNTGGLQYKRLDDDSVWQFDATGKLLTVTQRNGWVRTHTYSTASTPASVAPAAGLLIAVTNHFGRALSFKYNAASQLSSITTPDGRVISYVYDSTAATGRLTTVSYPGLMAGMVSKTYLYENSTYPQLLTGIIDENGSRLATYAYDSQGRGITTQYAGGAGLHSITYGAAGSATVTDPLGTQRTYIYGTSKGKLVVLGADKPSGTGNSSALSRLQDANGFITQETDFLGVNTMYTWDINRRLPLATTKAAGLPEVQTITTQWHSTYRLPVLVTEASRTTAYTYDSAGNTLSQTVSDAATSASRAISWAYNPQGLLATETDANGAVARSYAYYGTSSFSSTGDPNFDKVSLLLHGDGANGSMSITDSGPSPRVVNVVGGAQISTAQAKFGQSILFSGASYLSAPDTASSALGNGDFTIEAWVHPTAALGIYGGTRFAVIASKDGAAGRSWWFRLHGDTTTITNIQIAYTADGSNFVSSTGSVSGASSIPLNQWTHIAATRGGGFLRTFVNGILVSQSASTSAIQNTATPVTIGGQVWPNAEAYFPGYIDDVRLTKGLARYTATFTPPVQTFPNTGMTIDPAAIGHMAGDLQSITNAAGHVTQYTQYDRAGRVRQMIDPKGVVTDTTYTPRGWISSTTVTPPGGAARTTTYSYDNAGQLTGVVMPDASTLAYSYDAAHRLTGVTDAKGNTVTYTLDNMGNRVGEQVKDPQGNLQRNITRVYDALNRIQQTTGASN
jgi:YD repeat-containing protein